MLAVILREEHKVIIALKESPWVVEIIFLYGFPLNDAPSLVRVLIVLTALQICPPECSPGNTPLHIINKDGFILRATNAMRLLKLPIVLLN